MNEVESEARKMTDKQIIIDGVDVSGCKHFKIGTCLADYLLTDMDFSEAKCELCKDCYYKQLKRKEQECEELKQYKSLFEKTRNLWNESRMNNYKLLDEIKDLKDSLKRTICQSECYKHKEAEKLKQTLTKIKEIAERNHKTKEELFKIRHSRLTKFSMGALNGRHNLASEILQKISEYEVENDR